ncbi:hypothetical protein [Vibrio harveyi]|uniref:hypothetical protein n=1 Tax=Vibrio harveyi TaxID=669 RepID=UPI0018F18EBB|nr:hypothetical protein [Vibrio harveyi]
MLKIQIENVQDVFKFVENFGSMAGVWKQRMVSVEAMEIIDHACWLAQQAQGEDIHLHTLLDSYTDNNGHRMVTIRAKQISEDSDIGDWEVLTESAYGDLREPLLEYLKGFEGEQAKEMGKAVIAAMEQAALLLQAKPYHGKIRA